MTATTTTTDHEVRTQDGTLVSTRRTTDRWVVGLKHPRGWTFSNHSRLDLAEAAAASRGPGSVVFFVPKKEDPMTPTNDPNKAGQLAAPKVLLGRFRRFAVAPVHTRFESVSWFVWDAEAHDEDGRATVVRQEPTREDALRDLPLD